MSIPQVGLHLKTKNIPNQKQLITKEIQMPDAKLVDKNRSYQPFFSFSEGEARNVG
jgi:hypothetical protein